MNTTSPLLLSVRYNLQEEVNNVSIYIYPIIIILTLIINILNICVLCRRKLRSSACTYYFLAFALTSIVYMCEAPVMMFLRIRIGFAVTLSPVGCRLQTFVLFILPLFASNMLTFASVDRFFASTPVVAMRNISQVRVARRIIIITIILNVMYTTPFLFIYYFDSKTSQCVTYSSTFDNIYLSSRIVLSYIMIPVAMSIFGLLTIRNIQAQARRIAPAILNLQRQNRRRRTEGQLARMLILQISAYLVLSTPAGVGYTLVTFVPSMNTIFVNQLRVIFSLWQQGIYFLSFFLYILSSKTYRQELKNMFKLHQVTQFIERYITAITANDNRVSMSTSLTICY